MRWFFHYITVRKPVGGLKHIRLMASLLRELGVETYLLRDGAVPVAAELDDSSFYDVPVPEAPFSFENAGSHLSNSDVVVLPEVISESLRKLACGWKCRLGLYNQNGFYSLRFWPSPKQLGRPFDFAFASAPFVAALCETFHGIPRNRVFLVPYWVLREPFGPPEHEQERQLAVCCMPRKLSEQVQQVRQAVQRLEPEVPWVEIDGLPTVEVARRFRENAIFFSTQDQEGFGLPALEAMACGALVAGYPGTGGFPPPYARPDNGLWVRDGDMAAATSAVCKAIAVARQGGDERNRLLAAGRETALHYSKETTLGALAEMLRRIDGGRARPRTRRFDLGWRGKLAGLRVLYECDRLGWPGRVVSWLSHTTKPLRAAVQPWTGRRSGFPA